MVGVPGRSKGCKTCRRRKKGCDLQRPACGQCTRLGIVCSGYDAHPVYINAVTTSHGLSVDVNRSEPGPSSEAGSSPDADHSSSIAPVPSPAADHLFFSPYAGPSSTPQQSATGAAAADVTLPHSLPRSPYEDKNLSIFWDAFRQTQEAPVPSGGWAAGYATPTGWTAVAQDLYFGDAALRKIVLATCLSMAGRDTNEPWLMREGLRFYVHALKDVNVGLRNNARRKSDALLTASLALGHFELMFGGDAKMREAVSQAKSWQGHVVVEMALIEQRGPETHMSGHGHRLFADGRMQLAITSILRRKRSPFSSPEWKTVPWTLTPKSHKDLLVDILIDIPSLLETVDTLLSSPLDVIPTLWTTILTLYTSLDADLISWYAKHFPTAELADLESRSYAISPTSPRADLAVARATSLFWTACLLVYSNLHLALSHPAAAAIPLTPQPEISPRTDPRRYCAKIADIVTVFFDPAAGEFGRASAPFPVGVVLGFLQRVGGLDGPEARKVLGCMLRGGSGEGVARFSMTGLGQWPGQGVPGSGTGFGDR